jgi:hypothetical protein
MHLAQCSGRFYSQAFVLKLEIYMPSLVLRLSCLLRVAALERAMAEQRQQQQQQQQEGQRQASRDTSLHRFAAAPSAQMAVISFCRCQGCSDAIAVVLLLTSCIICKSVGCEELGQPSNLQSCYLPMAEATRLTKSDLCLAFV